MVTKVHCYFKLQWSDLPPHQCCSNTDTPRLAESSAHVPTMKPYSDSKTISLHRTNKGVASVLLLGLLPAAYLNPCPAIDYSIADASTHKVPWILGKLLCLQKCISGNCPKACPPLAFDGLCYLNYHDVGICKPAAMLWNLCPF